MRRYLEPTNASAGQERRLRLSEAVDPLAELGKGIKVALSQVLAPDYVEHGPQVDWSIDELCKLLPPMVFAFPNIAYKVEDMFGEGDKVVARYTTHGTHLGKYMDIQPTGKKVELNGIYIGRVAGGRIAEGWFVSTFLGQNEVPELLRLWLANKG